jgi:Rieske Fe-S protein
MDQHTHRMAEDHAIDGTGLTRRQALAAAAALCGVSAVAATGTGLAQASGTLRVTLANFPALSRIGGAAIVGQHDGVHVAVVRTGSKTYVALDRRCPHQGGIVGQSGDQWVCPLHNSRFELDGDKVSGVTPRGLRRLKTRVRKGTLVITV